MCRIQMINTSACGWYCTKIVTTRDDNFKQVTELFSFEEDLVTQEMNEVSLVVIMWNERLADCGQTNRFVVNDTSNFPLLHRSLFSCSWLDRFSSESSNTTSIFPELVIVCTLVRWENRARISRLTETYSEGSSVLLEVEGKSTLIMSCVTNCPRYLWHLRHYTKNYGPPQTKLHSVTYWCDSFTKSNLPETEQTTYVIIDGMALVQVLGKKHGANTFGELADSLWQGVQQS